MTNFFFQILSIIFWLHFFHSGGVKRTWIGVPRKLQTLDENGNLSVRCACVQLDELSESELVHIVEYDNCEANSTTCFVKVS